MKLKLKGVHVDQLTRFYRQGSVLAETIKSGCLGVELAIDVDSDEPAERISQLVRLAKASCFTHGTVAEPVAIETHVRLNSQSIETEAVL